MKSLSLSVLSVGLLALSSVTASSAHQHRISTRNKHRASAERRKAVNDNNHHPEARGEVVNGTEHINHLGKRAFNGVGTYYYTDVGLGACGQHSPNDKWSVALSKLLGIASPFGIPAPIKTLGSADDV